MSRKPGRYRYKGELLTVADIAERSGMPEHEIWRRIKHGPSLNLGPLPPRVRLITYQGRTLTLAAWARELGMPASTLADRILARHWPIERALTEPVMDKRQRGTRVRNTTIVKRIAATFRTNRESPLCP